MSKAISVGKATPFVLGLLLMVLTQFPVHATGLPAPGVVAVLMYADWCNSCKVLDPKLQAVRAEFEGSGILFTRFDFTNEGTAHQAGMLARALGLTELYQKNGGKTGYLALVDPASGTVLQRITKDHSEQDIQAALRQAASR